MIRSIFVSNDVSEYTIREILNCECKKDDSKSSFRAFKKAQIDGKCKKEGDDVILVV